MTKQKSISKFRGLRENVLTFTEEGFENMQLIFFDIPDEHKNKQVMIQSEGFCPYGLRYIYNDFMIDFMFKNATDQAIFGTRCNHTKSGQIINNSKVGN